MTTIYYHCREDISSKFSSNSEVFASELLENLGERFSRYYMQNNKKNNFDKNYKEQLTIAKKVSRLWVTINSIYHSFIVDTLTTIINQRYVLTIFKDFEAFAIRISLFSLVLK